MLKHQQMNASVEIRLLTERDTDQVWDILTTVYSTGDPMMTISDFSTEDMKKFVGSLVKKGLVGIASLGAFDRDTSRLVAISLSRLGKYEIEEHPREENQALPVNVRQQIASVQYFLGKDISTTFGTKDFFYLGLLCSRPEHARRGIATQLCRQSEQIARKEGCKKFIIVASSAFTQKIARKLGFVAERSIKYSDYIDPCTGKKIFESLAAPHVMMTVEVKDLR